MSYSTIYHKYSRSYYTVFSFTEDPRVLINICVACQRGPEMQRLSKDAKKLIVAVSLVTYILYSVDCDC